MSCLVALVASIRAAAGIGSGRSALRLILTRAGCGDNEAICLLFMLASLTIAKMTFFATLVTSVAPYIIRFGTESSSMCRTSDRWVVGTHFRDSDAMSGNKDKGQTTGPMTFLMTLENAAKQVKVQVDYGM
jgi:hypothetical protein